MSGRLCVINLGPSPPRVLFAQGRESTMRIPCGLLTKPCSPQRAVAALLVSISVYSYTIFINQGACLHMYAIWILSILLNTSDASFS